MSQENVFNALQSVSGNLGTVAEYAARKEQYQQQDAMAERREAANRSFQAALTKAKMDQDESQFQQSQAASKEDRADMLDYRNRELEATTNYRDASLSRQSASDAARLDIENKRLGIEQQRADNDKTYRSDNRQASVLGAQLTQIGKTIQFYQKQKDAAAAKLQADPNFQYNKTDEEKASALDAINRKYDSMITQQQQQYDSRNKAYSKITGTEFLPMAAPTDDGLDGGGDVGGDADSAGDAGDVAAPAGVPGAPAAPTGMAQPPAFHEGQRVRGKDGRIYVITNGKPVPEGQ